MRERLQAIGVWIVWIGGFATGVQYLAAGGALVVAAFAFLLDETPLLFRVFLFLGLFVIASVVFNYLIGMFLVRRRGRSSNTPPPPGLNELAQLQAKLREAKQERDELLAENKELIAGAEASKPQSETSEQPTTGSPPVPRNASGGPAVFSVGPGAGIKGLSVHGMKVLGPHSFMVTEEGSSVSDMSVTNSTMASPPESWWRGQVERAERQRQEREKREEDGPDATNPGSEEG